MMMRIKDYKLIALGSLNFLKPLINLTHLLHAIGIIELKIKLSFSWRNMIVIWRFFFKNTNKY